MQNKLTEHESTEMFEKIPSRSSRRRGCLQISSNNCKSMCQTENIGRKSGSGRHSIRTPETGKKVKEII
jgi:hypothetical protein